MKSMKCFLMVLLVISQLSLFPLSSMAEEKVETDSSVTEEEKYEQVLETEIGEVVVSATELQVGETVRIAVKPKNELVTNISGSLQLQKEAHPYAQARLLSFMFDEQTGSWIASYTVSPYDLGGSWYIHMTSFSGEEKLTEEKLQLMKINNEEPTLDKEPPALEELLILDQEETVHVTKGDTLTVEAKVTDVASDVQEVHTYIEGEQGHVSFPLQLSENLHWIGTYKITEALQPGTYEIFIEMRDTAGNGTVVFTRYKLIIEQDEETGEETGEDATVLEPIDEQEEIKEESEEEKVIITIIESEKVQQDEPVVVQKEERVEKQEQQNQIEAKAKQEISEKSNVDAGMQKEEQKAKEQKEEASIFNPSYLFSIIAGLSLLFAALKHNKSWE